MSHPRTTSPDGCSIDTARAQAADKPLIHYGPIWRRDPLASLALCKAGGSSKTMSTDLKWVNCGDCNKVIRDQEDVGI